MFLKIAIWDEKKGISWVFQVIQAPFINLIFKNFIEKFLATRHCAKYSKYKKEKTSHFYNPTEIANMYKQF